MTSKKLKKQTRKLKDLKEFSDLTLRYAAFTAILLYLWDFNPQFLIQVTQESAFFALQLLGYDVSLHDAQIQSPALTVEIVRECASFLAFLVLFALFAYTKGLTWRERVTKWIKGSIILFGVNVSRIVFIYWVGVTFTPKLALDVHLFIWQAMMAPFLIFLWFALMEFKTDRLPWVDDFNSLVKNFRK